MLVSVPSLCKVDDGLYIGDKDAARDIETLRKLRIQYVVNCTPDPTKEGAGDGVRNFWTHEISYHRVSVKDSDLTGNYPFTFLQPFWFTSSKRFIFSKVHFKGIVTVYCYLWIEISLDHPCIVPQDSDRVYEFDRNFSLKRNFPPKMSVPFRV